MPFSRRKRVLSVLVLALAMVASACSTGVEDQTPTTTTVAAAPTTAATSTTATSTTATSTTEVTSTTAPEDAVLTDAYSEQIRRSKEVTVDTSAFKKSPPYSIATVVQGPTNGWGTIFDTVMNYELEQSGKIGDQLYVPWDFTTESQANGIDDAIAKNVDAILLTSLSRAGLAAPVERAAKAGIPVIVCMAGVETDAYTVEVSRNIPLMGYETGKALAESLGGSGKVVLLHGIAGVDAAEFWRSGALAAFAEYPGIDIVDEEYGNWSVSDATQAMRSVIAAQDQIDGVWVGGLEMGVSVITAFKEAGRPMPVMAGTNPLNGFLRLALENNVVFSAAPFPPGASKVCVETLFKVLNGESVQKFNDVADLMEGTTPFTEAEAAARYRPEFNDDWIGPAVVPDDVYFAAGFGR